VVIGGYRSAIAADERQCRTAVTAGRARTGNRSTINPRVSRYQFRLRRKFVSASPGARGAAPARVHWADAEWR